MHIAIIGGGFCGTLLALNLIRQTQKPIRITLIEKSRNLAKGVAYSTTDPYHLLNVRAEKMEAFHEEPGHFLQWLNSNETLWRKKDPSFEPLVIHPYSYLPRMLYGLYLADLLKEGIEQAQVKNISFNTLTQEAVDLQISSNEVILTFLDRSPLKADFAVLALGVPPNKNFMPIDIKSSRYIPTLWSLPSQNLYTYLQANHLDEKSESVIIGSGLTMLDALSSLILRGFKGKITAVSRTGILSKVHAEQGSSYPCFIDLNHPPKTALEVFKLARREIKKAEAEGKDWRDVIDELRGVIGSVWELLSWNERKKGAVHLLNIWNYFRHRVPPVYFNELQRYMNSDRFTLCKGAVASLESANANRIRAHVKLQGGELKRLEADFIINCSGPEKNICKDPSVLVQNLLKRGEIVPDPLQFGIQVDSQGRVLGKGKNRLFALGQILLGERLETTAVPELRKQCADLAGFILREESL